MLDVIPSGPPRGARRPPPGGQGGPRLAPAPQAPAVVGDRRRDQQREVGPILPVSEAIVCARVAFTTLTRLAAAVAVLQDSGLRVRGIVLWDADSPPRV
jgi:hypothetical protein